MRSRAVFLPLACCFSTALAEPAWTASSRRRSRSASFPAVVWMSMSRDLGPRRVGHASLTMRQSSARDGSRKQPTAAPRTGPRPRGAPARARRRGGRRGTVHQRPRRRTGPRRCRRRAGAGRRAPDRGPRPPRADLGDPGPVRTHLLGAGAAAASRPVAWPLAAAADRRRGRRRPARRPAPRRPQVAQRRAPRRPQGRGLLVERVETPTGPAAVVGIGLNVSTTRAELPVDTATSLRSRPASSSTAPTCWSPSCARCAGEHDARLAAGGGPQGCRPARGVPALVHHRGQGRPGRPAGRRAAHRTADRHRRRRGGLVRRRAVRAVTVGAGDVVHVRPRRDGRGDQDHVP